MDNGNRVFYVELCNFASSFPNYFFPRLVYYKNLQSVMPFAYGKLPHLRFIWYLIKNQTQNFDIGGLTHIWNQSFNSGHFLRWVSWIRSGWPDADLEWSMQVGWSNPSLNGVMVHVLDAKKKLEKKSGWFFSQIFFSEWTRSLKQGGGGPNGMGDIFFKALLS